MRTEVVMVKSLLWVSKMKQKTYFGKRLNRVKLYKKGKFWVASTLTFISTELMMAAPVHASKVDSVSQSSVISQTITSSSSSLVSNSNLSSSSNSNSIESSNSSVSKKDSSSSLKSSISSSSISKSSATSSSSELVKSSSSSVAVSSSSQSSSASSVRSKTEADVKKSSSSINSSSLTSSSSESSSTSSSTDTSSVQDADAAEISNDSDLNAQNDLKVANAVTQLQDTPVVKNKEDNDSAATALTPNTQQDANDDPLKRALTRLYLQITDDDVSVSDAEQEYNYDYLSGEWYIFFEDEKGNLLPVTYPGLGYTADGELYFGGTGSSVRKAVKSAVQDVDNEGYTLDHLALNVSLTQWNNTFTFYLHFKEKPQQLGKPVTVIYKTQDGKVLGKGQAVYTNAQGQTDSKPYQNDSYDTSAKNFAGYHLVDIDGNSQGLVTNQPQTVTYIYAPNQESVTINFVDDEENEKNVGHVNVSGTFGSTASENVQDYVAQNLPNYVYVSTDWPGSIEFTTANNGKSYTVHLKHKTKQVTETKTVTQTIKYVFQDGKQAEPDHIAKITFQRTNTIDLADNNKVISSTAWQNMSNTDEFPVVQSPEIVGYTASFTSSVAVIGITADSNDNTQTITYTPNKYSITITYYDMDAKKLIQPTVVLEGDYGTSPNYDYQSVIDKLESEGYKVARDNIPADLKFDNTGKQAYEVDFTHTSTVLPKDAAGLTKVIKRTIHYVYADGKEAAADKIQTVTYTRTAVEDNVTHEIKYGNWTTTTNPAQFAAVTSPTITGYTPSMTTVSAESITSNTADQTIAVIYTANGGNQTPQSDLKTTVTQTIYYLKNDGTQLLQPTVTTITFTRKKNADGTYTPWQAQGADEFKSIAAPEIDGYTPNIQATKLISNVKATDANNVQTITYSPIEAQATITFYDETEKKNINVVSLSGAFGTSSTYSPAKEIEYLTSHGYIQDTGNSDFPASGSVDFETDNQAFTISFTHAMKNVSQTQTVQQQIKYQFADGSQAADPVIRSLTFTRNGVLDEATGQVTYQDWKPETTNTFSAVKSPVITGYTTSHPYSTAVTVDGSSATNVQVITYTPNTETATVTFVDQTSGKTIVTQTISGSFGTESTYSPADEISKLEAEGYVLVKNGYQTFKFDKDSTQPIYQFTITFDEGTTTSTESKTVNRTIYYEDQDGNQVASSYTDSITFTRQKTVNNVTHAVTYTNWNNTSSEFAPVQSPKVTGYTVQKGEEQSQAVTVTPDSNNVSQVITYTANQEQIKIEYIDAFDPNNPNTPNYNSTTVLSTDTLTGAYGTSASYSPDAANTKYTAEGYVPLGFGSDFPSDGLKFDVDGVQVYKYYYTHSMKSIPEQKQVTSTINYVMSDGSKAPSANVQTLTFNRTNTEDMVTKKITDGAWNVASQQTTAVTSPVIAGYTPDKKQVASITITPDMGNQTTTVTYTPDQEQFTVKFVDETTGTTLDTKVETGAFNTKTSYSPQAEINSYLAKGYVLVSNTFPQDGYTFGTSAPVYTVTLKHGTSTIDATSGEKNLTKNITRTINYEYADHSKAYQSATETVTFTRNAVKDNVTGQILSYGNWEASGNAFYNAVNSPNITGYTANPATVAQANVSANDQNTTVTVTYTANLEHATVIFQDDTTGKALYTQNLTGAYNSVSDYNPSSEIQKLVNSGYVLGQDGYPTDGKIFGKDGINQQFVIHFTEKTDDYNDQNNPEGLDLKHTVTHTIHYVYQNGDQAAADKTESLTFNRTATKNEATGQIVYSPWKVVGTTDDFAPIMSPEITGYTASAPESTAYNNVTPDTPIPDQTITYTPNTESATVTYWDDTDNKAMKVVPLTGPFGTTSDYNPANQIKDYQDKGYVMVENNVPENGIKFTAGNSNSYFIHFVHGTTTITTANNSDHLDLSHQVSRTIKYVYANQTSAHADNVQTLTFTRTATKDNVTGKITGYSDWTPASQTFNAVDSPIITGYHADQTTVGAVNNVNENSQSITTTVTYTPDTETAYVQYIDDTTGKVIHTDTLTGPYESQSTYSVQDELKQLNPGYVYVSTNFPTNGEIFNQAGKTPTYVVHLTEGTTNYTPVDNPEKLDLTDIVTQTIHYQFKDGTKAADDYETSIAFTRTATKNNVTGAITYNAWTPAVSDFDQVQSPTVKGYTPNKAQSDAVVVKPGDSDNVQTIVYTPNEEKATVNFIDDTTDKTIESDTLTGVYDSTSSFDLADKIKVLEAKGYQLVSDTEYPADGNIFNEDGVNQVFNIHLKETTTTYNENNNPENLDLTDTVTQTIHYQYANGQTAAKDATATVKFTRTATKNNVTGNITYSAWTPAIQNFDQVQSPVIEGYTPSAAQSSAVVVRPGDPDNVQTIKYTANKEHATINFVDDTNNKVLDTVNLTGAFDSKATFDMANALKQLQAHGYVIGQNNYPADGNVFNKDGVNQVFTVHVTEGTTHYTTSNNPENLELSDTVTQTIHYVFADGTQAAKDVVKTVSFTRDAVKNNVTGVITYGNWTPAVQNFSQVQSPVIEGYTPSAAQSTAVTVKPGDQDNVQKIVYTPNQEQATVKVIDLTTGNTLETDDLTGAYGTKANFDVQSVIDKYTKQGYVFVRSTFPTDGYRFTTNAPQFDIYLQHGTDTDPSHLDLTATVTETIKYVYADGREAKPTQTLTLTFHRTGKYDDVTHTATYGDWQADNGTTFKEVPTPVITGYTPDKTSVAAVNGVTADTPDQTITVTYKANQEYATVTYVDATENKTIATANINGAFGTTSTYSPDATIKQLEAQGYEVVTDDFPQAGIVFNQDGKTLNYMVTLKHKTLTETPDSNPDNLDLTNTVTETIKYVYADGDVAAKTYTAAVKYTRTATKDLVTNKVEYTDWQPVGNSELPQVVSPTITGYTADKAQIAPIQTHAGMDLAPITVTYSPNQEQATVTYYDETSQQNISVANLNGAFGSKSAYNPQTTLDKLIATGYEVVSNDFPANGIVFNQDGTVQNYRIVLKHGTSQITSENNPGNVDLTSTVTQVINYVYDDGTQAAPTYEASVTYTRTATKDNVTGQIISYSDWSTTANRTLPAVVSPTITGYTPDIAQVKAVETSPEEELDPVTVTYKANQEHAKVEYYDETAGTVITIADVSGAFGSASSYNPAPTIKQLIDQGYEIVSDDFPLDGIKFNQDGKVPTYTITFKHGTETETADHNLDNLDLKQTVNETINYQYQNGSQAAPSVHATITFTRDAVKDKVTGKVISYSNWQATDNGEFAGVKSPVIEGYTADPAYVDAIAVTPDSVDQTITVTYAPDQEQASVTYIDDTTGQVLTTENLTGNFGSKSTYDAQSVIQNYEKQGYQLVSSDYPTDGFTFNDKKQQFTIHLKHEITTDTVTNDPDQISNLSRTVTRTIIYKYSDGKQAAKTKIQKVNFTRNATYDHVTKEVTYGKWQVQGLDEFLKVVSPYIKGYLPNIKSVDEVDHISATTPNVTTTVIYTSDIQHATVTYIDTTTGKTLQTVDISGDLNTTSDYRTAQSIKDYEAKGYKVVSDNYPDNGAVFDQKGVVKQYTVKLAHQTAEYNPTNPGDYDLSQTVSRTIYYLIDTNARATNEVHAPTIQKVTFTRTATKDLVTGEITYTPWKADGQSQFAEFNVPQKTGYTPSQETVSAWNAQPNDGETTLTVLYTPNKEHATVTYIDQTTGKTIKVDQINGVFGQTADYDVTSAIQALEKQGYELVSNDYPAAGLTFDQDGKQLNYKVVLKEGTKTTVGKDNPAESDLNKEVTRTIKFVDSTGKEVAAPVVQTVHFTRNKTQNLVTGAITYTDWQADGQTEFDQFKVPVKTGYTPSQAVVPAWNAQPSDSDQELTVTYTANKEHATVTYIDQTTGKTIKVDQINGVFGQTADYDITSEIQALEKQGYELVSNDYPIAGLTFDQDGKQLNYTVVMKEGTKITVGKDNPAESDLNKEVTRTIKFVDSTGKEVAAPIVQTVHFTRNEIQNLVTGAITYTDWQAEGEATFDQVTVPVITGYTAAQTQVEAQTGIQVQTPSRTVTVVYTKNESVTSQPSEPGTPVTPEIPEPSEPEKPAAPETPVPSKPTKSTQTAKPVKKQVKIKHAVQAQHKKQHTTHVSKVEKPVVKVQVNKAAKNAPKQQVTTNKLPQTGENSTSGLWGTILLMLSSLLGFFGFRKKDDEKDRH